MGIEFISVLKPGPVYVGALLSEMSDDVQKIIIIDEKEGLQHVVVDDDWRAVVPVYILNKEVKECDTTELDDGGHVLRIRV